MDKKIGHYFIRLVCLPCFLFLTFGVKAQLATQVGIGALYFNGDVDHVFDPMNSFHLGISKSVKNNLMAELKLGISTAIGLSGQYLETAQNGGALVENVYEQLENRPWYPNYISKYAYADLGVNYLLDTGIDRLRLLGGMGIGFSVSSLNINILSGDTAYYELKFPLDSDIEQVKASLDRLYDSTYETNFSKAEFLPHLSFQLGLQFRIARGIYLSVDARYHLTNSDNLDAIKYVSPTQESGDNDSVSMFTIGFVGYLLADRKQDRIVK